MRLGASILLCFMVAIPAQASQCLSSKKLIALDRHYEEALRVGDVKFLRELLAEDFVWVHNLAVDIETKPVLLARLEDQQEIAEARTTTEVDVHRLDKTAVLSGLSSVDKISPGEKNTRTSRYRFMRTYVSSGNQCRLLSVQTMKVWSSAGN